MSRCRVSVKKYIDYIGWWQRNIRRGKGITARKRLFYTAIFYPPPNTNSEFSDRRLKIRDNPHNDNPSSASVTHPFLRKNSFNDLKGLCGFILNICDNSYNSGRKFSDLIFPFLCFVQKIFYQKTKSAKCTTKSAIISSIGTP